MMLIFMHQNFKIMTRKIQSDYPITDEITFPTQKDTFIYKGEEVECTIKFMYESNADYELTCEVIDISDFMILNYDEEDFIKSFEKWFESEQEDREHYLQVYNEWCETDYREKFENYL